MVHTQHESEARYFLTIGLFTRQRDDDAQHVAFGLINSLGLCGIISFAAQYPTPHDRCVRFATVVTGDHATLARGRLATALPQPVFHRLDRASFAWRTDNGFNRYQPGQGAEVGLPSH